MVSRSRNGTRRRRRTPDGIWFTLAIFILTALILRHWLSFSVNPAAAGAPSDFPEHHSVGKSGIAALKNLPMDRSALAFDLFPAALPGLPLPATEIDTAPQNESSHLPVFEVRRLGPPIVPGSAILFEAWPGTRAPAAAFETAAVPVSEPEHTTPVAEPFAGALLCAGLGGICWMMRYRLIRI